MNVIHPPGHVLQLNCSKGFVALRSNNSSLPSFLTSSKPTLCLSLFLPAHCFICQHEQRKFFVLKQKSGNISFRTIVTETVDDAEQSCMTLRLFVILSCRIYFDDSKPANKSKVCCPPAATHCVYGCHIRERFRLVFQPPQLCSLVLSDGID